MTHKEYLGDGVYVDFERGGHVLTAEDGVFVTNTIYLEPEVNAALTHYAARRVGLPVKT